MNVLHIDSSILGAASASRQLSAAVVEQLRQQHPNAKVQRYDLDLEPLSHLSAAALAQQDPTEAARAERVMRDFLDADVLVIGAPMYNFSVPSTLKAWIDRIAVAGKTFRYTANGPEGLATGKRAYLVITQGGVHELGGPSEHHESYLRFVLNFVGISDIEVVRAQGLAMSPEHRQQAISAAAASVDVRLAA